MEHVNVNGSNSQRKFMLTTAIHKEKVIVYFTQSKMKKTILSFFIWNFAIEFISFSKRKEFNNGFDDWHSDVWLFFFVIYTREVP